MKNKLISMIALILILAMTILPAAAQEEDGSSFNKNLKNCASSISFYEKYLKPYRDGTAVVGDDEWETLVTDMRVDNGISCGYVASRNPGDDLAEYADDIYDAAYFTAMGLEFQVLALENPEIADILNEKAKKFLFDADELYAPILKIIK